MRRWFEMGAVVVAAVILVVGLTLTGATGAAAEEKGPEIFKAQKCNKCHAVKAAGIEKTKSEAAAGEEEDKTEAAGEKKEPPDLSGVGLDKEVNNAAFLTGFLSKKEKLHEKLHRKKFTGTGDELKTLVDWLLTLKTAPAK